MFFKRKKVKKQYALFVEAIREAAYPVHMKDVRIDHALAKCYSGQEEFEVVFPLRFLRESRKLNYEKIHDFCFRGKYTPKREWVNEFASAKSRITFTDHGREIAKDYYDVEYYQEMANSMFTICPQGDFKWTYRFLEAIMCRSIPIIERGSEHEQCEGFTFFYSDRTTEELMSQWNESALTKNYDLFLKRHTLLDRFIFL